MLVGSLIWANLIANFCGVTTNSDPDGTEFRVTMDYLNRFLHLVNAPLDMRTRLREYFHQTKHLQQVQWQSVAISEHQWPSVTISGHQ